MRRSLFTISCLCWALVSTTSVAQQFTEWEINITPTTFGAVALGDLNADGFLDVAISGIRPDGSKATQLYRNTGTSSGNRWIFNQISSDLPGFEGASLDLGDYDNDNDLDILLTGGGRTLIYRNDNGSFTFVSTGLPGVERAGGISDIVSTTSSAWGDYDNDGDLDIMLTGGSDAAADGSVSALYRNEGNDQFVSVPIVFPSIVHGSVDWGDYDGDGDLDLLVSSRPTDGSAFATVFRNDDGQFFQDVNPSLPAIELGSLTWRDFDHDADLDILVTGGIVSEPPPFAQIYRNDNGTFVLLDETLPPSWFGAWMDQNNDGRLEVLLNGTSGSFNTFIQLVDTESDAPAFGSALQGVWWGAIALGDIDRDHDMDLLTTGSVQGGTSSDVLATFHSNEADTVNTPPMPPTELISYFEGTDLVLLWNDGFDIQTPTGGLSYNLRVGTEPGSSNVVSAMALPDGTRLLPKLGNAGHSHQWRIRNIDRGRTYYWTVQTIDSNLEGSAFALEQESNLTAGVANDEAISPTGFHLDFPYPNPFTTTSTIPFSLAEPSHIDVTVFDVLGNEVAHLRTGQHPRGRFQTSWDGTTQTGSPVAAGVYYCRLVTRAGTFVQPLLYIP